MMSFVATRISTVSTATGGAVGGAGDLAASNAEAAPAATAIPSTTRRAIFICFALGCCSLSEYCFSRHSRDELRNGMDESRGAPAKHRHAIVNRPRERVR